MLFNKLYPIRQSFQVAVVVRSRLMSTTTPTPPTATTPHPVATPSAKDSVSVKEIKLAYHRIKEYLQKSPLDYSPQLSILTGANLYLKKEHLSLVGSYKERGALNKLLTLTPEETKKGVVCSSAGNHAQAVSHHATRMGIDAKIVMPITTPFVKANATRKFGGTVILHGDSFGAAYEKACEIAANEGRTFIHAFNDPAVVAGQGTVALELLEQNPFLDAIVVPVGGGGLIAGVSKVIKEINPRIKVYGVESVAMPGMLKSVEAGQVTLVPKRPSMADGIAIERIGAVPFDIIKKYVDKIVLVEEDEIAQAVLTLLEREKTVVEGSAATALAAVIHNKFDVKDQTIALIMTGGNIDMTVLGQIIEKGMVKEGRLCRVRVTVPDMPGQLVRVLNIVAELRANIRNIEHERAFLLHNVGVTQPILTLETEGFEHVGRIIQKIADAGFPKPTLETPHL